MFDLLHRMLRPSEKLRHAVRVEVTRPDLSVRARKTYFEEPRQEK